MEEITGKQKYANYKEQFDRLKKALEHGFHLEAMFIIYAIMEDRTESILRHAGRWEQYMKSRRGHDATIDSKVRFIQKQAEQKDSLLHKHFSDDLLPRILDWKNQRNRLIHALLKQELAHDEIKNLAIQGNELVRTLRARATAFNRAAERKVK